MSHLTNDELVDAVEQTLRRARLDHIDTCESCRVQVHRLAAILHDVRAVATPEPSPLFWEAFSAHVRAGIVDQPSPRVQGFPVWLRGPVIVPIAALALLVFTLATTMPPSTAPQVVVATSQSSTDVANLEPEWALVVDMVGDLDVETAQEVGIGVGHNVAERAALELEAGEQQELMRLMREEIERAGG